MGSGVTEGIKLNTLKLFGYVERVHEERLVKMILRSKEEGNKGRRRQLVSWAGTMGEYIRERTQECMRIMEHAGEVYLDGEPRDFSAMAITKQKVPRGTEASEIER